MDQQFPDNNGQKPEFMEEEMPEIEKDALWDLLVSSKNDRSIQIEKIQKPIHYRSTKNLVKRSDFRRILNSSSSNDKLIPSSIKGDSSVQNSSHDFNQLQNENEKSFNSQSFRKSFKKKFEESFSVQNTIRDSSSSFSERSDSINSHNIIIPQIYKEQEPVQQKKLGCHCKKSKCLKLYCECFQKQVFCSQHCNCYSCGNREGNHEEHHQAVIEALARNVNSFADEESSVQNKGFSLGVELGEVRKGCKCKKTKCLKKYCECFHMGITCTIFCRCEGCYNKQGMTNLGTSHSNHNVMKTSNIF